MFQPTITFFHNGFAHISAEVLPFRLDGP
uniref:Uncharacterized protein n=1 Tax=Arundo donax TaxID=35708 RepID=A0A0A8YC99_ARUDO